MHTFKNDLLYTLHFKSLKFFVKAIFFFFFIYFSINDVTLFLAFLTPLLVTLRYKIDPTPMRDFTQFPLHKYKKNST